VPSLSLGAFMMPRYLRC